MGQKWKKKYQSDTFDGTFSGPKINLVCLVNKAVTGIYTNRSGAAHRFKPSLRVELSKFRGWGPLKDMIWHENEFV